MSALEFSDDELDDHEYPDGFEDYGDDEPIFISCPNCKAAVYEDSEQCPKCGDYIIHHSTAFSGRSWLWTLLGILGIVAMILSLILY